MKIDRLVSETLLLLERERLSARELAERFEISVRTVYRDMEALGLAGVPVRSLPGVNGGFEIMPGYKVDRKCFSPDELSALLTGLSALSGVVDRGALICAAAKLKSVIPAEQAAEVTLRADQLCIDLEPWMGNESIQPYLELIRSALRERRVLSFSYVDGHGNRTERTAEPYQLVLKSGHWYVQGYCRARQDFRLFRLTRMEGLRTLEEIFTPRPFEKPVLDFSGMLKTMQTDITLRIHRAALDRVLELCARERITPEDETHYLVRFPFIENDFYYGLLLGLGAECECLAPVRVRAELMRRVRAMAGVYGL